MLEYERTIRTLRGACKCHWLTLSFWNVLQRYILLLAQAPRDTLLYTLYSLYIFDVQLYLGLLLNVLQTPK